MAIDDHRPLKVMVIPAGGVQNPRERCYPAALENAQRGQKPGSRAYGSDALVFGMAFLQESAEAF